MLPENDLIRAFLFGIIMLSTIGAIVLLEVVALDHGINGTLLKSVLTGLGAAFGYFGKMIIQAVRRK